MVCPAHMLVTSHDLSNAFGRSEKAAIPHAQIPLKYAEFRPLLRLCPGHLPAAALGWKPTLPHPYIRSL